MLSRRCIGYVLITAGAVNCAALDDSTWYKRYPAYPEYCSTPEQMQRRAIPPLQENPRVGETRLVHVTSIIRHGARTADRSSLDCWKGYVDNSKTGVQDCNLTDVVMLPLAAGSNSTILLLEMAAGSGDATFLNQKKNDTSPPGNNLEGTCVNGQLVLRGAQQELQNGKHLRNAYTYDGSILFEHDPRMRLFDLNSDDSPPYLQIHVRSNLIHRTIMSAQLVLKGLFGDNLVKYAKQYGRPPVIPLHTADSTRADETQPDVLQPYRSACPQLDEIRAESYNWDERKAYDNSDERNTLLNFMRRELGGADMVDNAIECIMTTICMDRPLPEALHDYGRPINATKYNKKYGANLLKRVSESDFESWGLTWRYGDGAFAKMGIGPLWAEIMRNILPVVNRTHSGENNTTPPIMNRLALFSGHDTTILPLLISLSPNLWDGQWAPYAAMLIIEIHEIIDGLTDRAIYKSDFAFRLLMDGKVLTSKVKGCPTNMDLCDVQVLLDRVTPFATTNCDYMATRPESGPTGTNNLSVDRDTPVANTNGNYTAMKSESIQSTTDNSGDNGDAPFATIISNYTATKPGFNPKMINISSVIQAVLLTSTMLLFGLFGSFALHFVTRKLYTCKNKLY